MKRLFPALMAFVMAIPLLTSCNDGDDGPNTVYYTNIVNFEKNIPSYAVFTYQKEGDSPLIELQARAQIDTKVLPDGSRCVITYNYYDNNSQGGSGIVNLIGINYCYTDTVSTASTADVNTSLPYTVVANQRSGTWLNFNTSVAYVEQFFARKFRITALESTLNDDYPQLYLTTEVAPGTDTGVDYRTFVSVNIAPVWNLPTCKGVDVHVYHAEGDTQASVISFRK